MLKFKVRCFEFQGAGIEEADVTGLSFLQCDTCTVQYGGNLTYDFEGRAGSTLALGPNGFQIASLAPVPEPGQWAMLGLGLAAIAAVARRRQGDRAPANRR